MCAWLGCRVGEMVGPYRTLQLLGKGAFSEVVLAEDTSREDRPVALKVAACSELAEDAAARARDVVLSEAALLRRLAHPHIVICEDVRYEDELHLVWLALELMDGGTLKSLIECRHSVGTPFEAKFVRRVVAEIGSALQYIHTEGVLHRDVKPSNILLTLTAPPVLKLADFGVSKLLQATGHAVSTVGTQYYFSPEIASGKPYGAAADAWALGVCLYELAALRRPFTASSPYALACLICEAAPPELPSGTAPDVVQTIMGLLDKDPDQRLQLSDALCRSEAAAKLAATASRRQSAESPSPSPSPSPPPRPQRLQRGDSAGSCFSFDTEFRDTPTPRDTPMGSPRDTPQNMSRKTTQEFQSSGLSRQTTLELQSADCSSAAPSPRSISPRRLLNLNRPILEEQSGVVPVTAGDEKTHTPALAFTDSRADGKTGREERKQRRFRRERREKSGGSWWFQWFNIASVLRPTASSKAAPDAEKKAVTAVSSFSDFSDEFSNPGDFSRQPTQQRTATGTMMPLEEAARQPGAPEPWDLPGHTVVCAPTSSF